MTVASVQDRAVQIYNRLQRTGKSLMVGMVVDRFVTAEADSVDMMRWFDRKPQDIVGIYDSRCPIDWIEEDLSYMHSKFVQRTGLMVP